MRPANVVPRLCLIATLVLAPAGRQRRTWWQRLADAFPTVLAVARHTRQGLALWAPLLRNRRLRTAAMLTLLLLAISRIGEFVFLPGLDVRAWCQAWPR